MSPQYAPLAADDHPQTARAPTRESTAWFWSRNVQVVSVEHRMPTPQDAVFSNIIPVRTSETEDLERALVSMGFISEDQLRHHDAPPHYQPAPSYETVEDPVTLASYLFKYGFVFPLFWLVGAFIIISDLHQESHPYTLEPQPPSPTAPKSIYELQLRREEMALLRLAELKWAWRCAYAFAIWLVFFITALGIALGTGYIRLF